MWKKEDYKAILAQYCNFLTDKAIPWRRGSSALVIDDGPRKCFFITGLIFYKKNAFISYCIDILLKVKWNGMLVTMNLLH